MDSLWTHHEPIKDSKSNPLWTHYGLIMDSLWTHIFNFTLVNIYVGISMK